MTERRHVGLATPAAADLSFKPYVLFRRGMLPYARLAPLVPARTWALLAEIDAARITRQALARRIGDRLYALMPSFPASGRPDALRVRRDLHNDRLPPASVCEAVEGLLDPDDSAALAEWRASRVAAEEFRVRATDLLATELDASRRELAQIAADTQFVKGIQLSSPHLCRNVREYVSAAAGDDPTRDTRRLRQTESTIVRYAYRMSLRTAPFGAFTEVGAQPWQPLRRAVSGERRHVGHLNRSALAWMVCELRRIEGLDRVLQLRLNNTARPADGVIELFARGMEGSGDSCWHERFVQIRMIRPVQLVVDALADGPCAKADVLQRLVDHGLARDQASALVERLIAAGLCHQDLALPDQATRVAGAVAARLRTMATPAAAACAGIFEGLQGIEDAFGPASVATRDRLLTSLADHIRRFADVSGAPLPRSLDRALLFEDVAAHQPARTWCPDLVERNRGHFLRLQRLLPVFDDATVARLGVYRWFVSRYGEKGRHADLLTVYRAFAEQSPADITAVMQGIDEPAAEAIRAHQRVILAHLAERVAAAGDAPVVHLDGELVDDLVAACPSAVAPWTEASYRVQVSPASVTDRPLLVVNNVAAGHGVFFSRFCDLVEPPAPGAWSLRQSVRDAIARDAPRQADLTALLGFNVNLHPGLAPLEVVYPGSIASGGHASTLRDLALEADHDSRCLRLIDRRDGRAVNLAPMNFLLPVAAPRLYRFLCVLGPVPDYGLGLWDRLRQWSRRDYAYLPRLTLGDLVLERRRWSVPLIDVRALTDRADPERLETLVALRRWQEASGIPRECFFRTQRIADRDTSATWADETRLAFNVRGARRKGQYLDFWNPFLLRLLVDRVRTADGAVISFHECLPPTALYRSPEVASAEELLVECRTREMSWSDR
jgi:hypothetical protein